MKNYPVKITDVGTLPLTVAEVKANLRIEDDEQDTLLTAHLTAAVSYAESYCNRIFHEQAEAEFYQPYLCQTIDLPKQMQTVVSVQYRDLDNELVTIGDEDYGVINSSFGSAWLEFFDDLPSTYDRGDAVVITLQSGDCPASVKAAIHLIVEGLYDGDKDRNEKAIKALLDIEANPFI